MLLGGRQNTIKSQLVFTALFCFAPFSVFSSRMSAPYLCQICKKFVKQFVNFFFKFSKKNPVSCWSKKLSEFVKENCQICQKNCQILSKNYQNFVKKNYQNFHKYLSEFFVVMRENIGNIGQKAQLAFWQQCLNHGKT
jgi:hypothetical protein